jgi:hypothetical protein
MNRAGGRVFVNSESDYRDYQTHVTVVDPDQIRILG